MLFVYFVVMLCLVVWLVYVCVSFPLDVLPLLEWIKSALFSFLVVQSTIRHLWLNKIGLSHPLMVWGDIKPPVGKGELYEPIKRKKKMPSPRCLNTLVAHFFICEMIVLNYSYPWKHVSESRYALERSNGQIHVDRMRLISKNWIG